MLGIIPARAGSKRFPGKNLSSVAGRSLIERTITGAKNSGIFDQILFSSDDPKALDMAATEGGVICQERPASLAGDDVRTIAVVQDILNQDQFHNIEAVMVLFVTTPFRNADHIREAKTLLDDGCDSVLSIQRCPNPPQFALSRHAQLIEPWVSYDYFRKTTRKQALEPLFQPNFAIQAAKRSVVLTLNGFLGNRCGSVEMSAHQSVDIDTPDDLAWANYLATHTTVDQNP